MANKKEARRKRRKKSGRQRDCFNVRKIVFWGDIEMVYLNNWIISGKVNKDKRGMRGMYRCLLPPLAMIEIGKVLEFEAKKYGANNWRNGMQ